jgi:DNA-binding protein HU-beta
LNWPGPLPQLARLESGPFPHHNDPAYGESNWGPLKWADPLTFPLLSLGSAAIHPQQNMAKALSKSQIAASLAESVGLTKKQAVQSIEALVALAYKNAKNSFTIPGLGKIVLVNRKARMGRNPATGEAIKIAAKRVVKFRVAKAAKDAILGTK